MVSPCFLAGIDVHMWMLEPSGSFSIKSIVNVFQPGHVSLLYYKLLRNPVTPIKYSIFMWKLINDFLAFQCHCRNGTDDTNHIFWSCSFTQEVWRAVIMHIGFANIPWGSFRSAKDCVTFWWLYGQDKDCVPYINLLVYFFFDGISSTVGITLQTFFRLLHELGLHKYFHSFHTIPTLHHIHTRVI